MHPDQHVLPEVGYFCGHLDALVPTGNERPAMYRLSKCFWLKVLDRGHVQFVCRFALKNRKHKDGVLHEMSMRDRLFVMDTSVAPKPEETVQVDTAKLLGDLLFAVRGLSAVCEGLQTRIEALEDEATMPMIEVEPTRYGRAVICGTIYEIDEDEDNATIKIHPSDGLVGSDCLAYTSETVAGAVAYMLDDLGDNGMDFLLGIALAAEDLVGQDEA